MAHVWYYLVATPPGTSALCRIKSGRANLRGVAQPDSALLLGSSGRGFESHHPDQSFYSEVVMKLSVSMAYSPKQAAGLVTAQLDQIVVNLAKIACHKPSTTDKEWSDEIKNKHFFEIAKKANKTSDKKGHLSKDVLIHLWTEAFDEHYFSRYVSSVFSDTAYRRKAKSGTEAHVSAKFARVRAPLASVGADFADAVLSKDWAKLSEFSQALVDVVFTSRVGENN